MQLKMKLPTYLFVCVLILCANEIRAYKILGVFPFASPSHYFLGNELMKGLAIAGHEATILTVFEEKNPPNELYKQIVLDGLSDKQQDLFNYITNSSAHKNFFSNPFKMLFKFIDVLNVITEMTLNHTKTQNLIKSKRKYDIVIVTQFTVEALKALAPHFDAHLVIFNNHESNSWMNSFVGNPSLPSLNSEIILGYVGRMTFKQRLVNTLLCVAQYVNANGLVYPHHADLTRKYISKDLDLNKILYNVSLVLCNSHVSLNKASGLVPGVKEIAGFHVKPPKKLPDDLQKFLDESKYGVIYFSMGSNLKSADLSAQTRQHLMNAFSKRKENILWKFEAEDLPGKPPNVKIEKWLPQSDLLAHPNVKLFITHGGFLSNIETIYHGVPIISLPAFGDQLKNARQAEYHGYAKVLDMATLNDKILLTAIEEVLSNTKYSENVKARSRIFHDRQIKPLDEAVYWLEYVVRHNGATHLRVEYIDLAWYQYYLIDVFAFIFFVLFLVLLILKKIVSFTSQKLCKNCKNKESTKKIKKQ